MTHLKTRYMPEGDYQLIWNHYRAANQVHLAIWGLISEPQITASVCIPESTQLPGEIFIKDYSENEGILDALIKAGILVDTGKRIKVSPWVEVAICRIINMEGESIDQVTPARV